jgi:FO synthase
MRTSFDDTLQKALSGGQLTAAEGCVLADADEDETASLLGAAADLRTRLKGRTVTYSRKVFLPITNLCADSCAYCTFRKSPDDPEAWTMSPEEIQSWVLRGAQQGCKEALVCLGDKPERVYPQYRAQLAGFGVPGTVDYILHTCCMALEYGLLPHTNAGVLSRAEMQRLRPVNASMGLMLENVSPRLRLKGHAHSSAPDKEPALRLGMMRDAGELAIPFTTGILVGIGETRDERVDSLIAIRELQREFGHIQEVIIQSFRAKPGTRMAGFEEPEDIELARTVAIARLMLGDMNIQAPPNLSPRAHRLLLRAGINDWGGISPVTLDYINPEAAWPEIEELSATCRQEGFTLRERLAIYREYIDAPGFLEPALRPRVYELQESITA